MEITTEKRARVCRRIKIRMGRKITTIVVGGVFLAAASWFAVTKYMQNSPAIDLGMVSGSVQKKQENRYTIAGMRQRTFDSRILDKRQVRETSGFTSYVVSFVSEGYRQYALVNMPKGNVPDGGWPVVVVNHGYIDPKVYSTENSYINTSAYFANAGFAVFKPDYRGHNKSEGDSDHLVSRMGYAEDVLNLLAAIKKQPEINTERIYMYGHSMGGDVTLRVLEVCGKCVAAATLWAPAVTVWPDSVLHFLKNSNGDPKREERAERFMRELQEVFTEEDNIKVSTFENLRLIEVPINIHHGTADDSVPYGWGEALAAKLKELHRENYFYTYKADNHDIAQNWSTALRRDVELFSGSKN